MLAFELGGNMLDRALHAKRLAARDACKRLLLLEHVRTRGGGAEIKLRHERDYLFGAGGLAETALHAGIFRKTQHRPFGIVAERAGRTGGYAGETEGAALNVEPYFTERRTRRQRDHVDRRGRGEVQFSQREPHHVALAADSLEARRPWRWRGGFE